MKKLKLLVPHDVGLTPYQVAQLLRANGFKIEKGEDGRYSMTEPKIVTKMTDTVTGARFVMYEQEVSEGAAELVG